MVIETRSAFISLQEDMIIEVKVKKDMHVEIAEALENHGVISKLNPKGEFPLLLQTQGIFTISPEVLARGGSEESAKLYCAMALLIDPSSPGLIANFFIKVSKPINPVKIFTDRAEAIAWLKEQYRLARK